PAGTDTTARSGSSTGRWPTRPTGRWPSAWWSRSRRCAGCATCRPCCPGPTWPTPAWCATPPAASTPCAPSRARRCSGRRRGATRLQTAEPADGFYSPRELTYIQPAGRRLSDYEAAICHVQPDVAHYDFGGWLILAPDGENLFEESSTRLRHPDWFQYRDPSS